MQKVENMQKRALRFLYNDQTSTYQELLRKAGKTTMNVYRLKLLCTEIYKCINNFSPSYIKNIFQLIEAKRPIRNQHLNNLVLQQINQTTFGTKSLRSLGPQIWNSLPSHIKCSQSLESFKNIIKMWDGEKCTCL